MVVKDVDRVRAGLRAIKDPDARAAALRALERLLIEIKDARSVLPELRRLQGMFARTSRAGLAAEPGHVLACERERSSDRRRTRRR